MPPPKHLKKEKDKNAFESLGIDLPPSPPRQNLRGTAHKILRLGMPPQPLHEFPFPAHAQLSGTQRERIDILSKSIHGEEFLERLKDTNFFEINAHYRQGEFNEWLHIGEVYVYGAERQICSYSNTLCSNGHAWITFDGQVVIGWHYCHSAGKSQGIPTFLLSIENYLMYMHLRMGLKLPKEILNANSDLRAWV